MIRQRLPQQLCGAALNGYTYNLQASDSVNDAIQIISETDDKVEVVLKDTSDMGKGLILAEGTQQATAVQVGQTSLTGNYKNNVSFRMDGGNVKATASTTMANSIYLAKDASVMILDGTAAGRVVLTANTEFEMRGGQLESQNSSGTIQSTGQPKKLLISGGVIKNTATGTSGSPMDKAAGISVANVDTLEITGGEISAVDGPALKITVPRDRAEQYVINGTARLISTNNTAVSIDGQLNRAGGTVITIDENAVLSGGTSVLAVCSPVCGRWGPWKRKREPASSGTVFDTVSGTASRTHIDENIQRQR